MDQFLMVKKEEVISYLKVLKESYEKKARLYKIKQEIESKKKIKNESEICKYLTKKNNYLCGLKRIEYVLEWYEFGVVPEDDLHLRNAIFNGKEITEFILCVLEQRLLDEICKQRSERRRIMEKNMVKKR